MHLNIICLVCINLHYTSYYAKVDRNAWISPNFRLGRAVKLKAIIICLHTEFVQTKFNTDTLCRDNHHQSFSAVDISLGSTCHAVGLAESTSSRLARILSGQCVKLSDDTPCVAMLPTLSDPQDLDPEYLEANFPVQ